MTDEDAYRALAHELSADPRVSEAKAFGIEVLKVGRKIFGGHRDGELVLKLGPERSDELVAAGVAARFDPLGGRPMTGWVTIPPDHDDWLGLAEEAKAFVAAEAGG